MKALLARAVLPYRIETAVDTIRVGGNRIVRLQAAFLVCALIGPLSLGGRMAGAASLGTMVVRIHVSGGVHLDRVSVLASDSVEAAEREAAANGKGGALVWLEPMRGEMFGVPDEDDGEAWTTPRPIPSGSRGLLGRLRSWWMGRSAGRRPERSSDRTTAIANPARRGAQPATPARRAADRPAMRAPR